VGERILDALQLLDVGHFIAVEQRVAVVEPGADDAASDGVRHSAVQHWSDVSQSSDVKVAGRDVVLYMLVEG
jgi:hypothetical protein